jgi:enoyl-CoA hydratase/carnithine racemase
MDQRRAAEIGEENEAVSRATFEAVQRLNTLPIPTVALVQGGCFGGGTGVISACDVVIAADNALFSITEVRWGPDGRDHHPATLRRHRREAGPPLRADRRTFWRG